MPQPAVVRLASEGMIGGAVLDVGCGTGDNAIHLAGLGLEVCAVDVAEAAVAIARQRAAARDVEVAFSVADALHLDGLGRVFDTVLDCALFHAFDQDERRVYVGSLASVTRSGARLYVLCFSDTDPETAGPHPVSRQELSAPFTASPEWGIASVAPERLLSRFAPDGVPAWLATIDRI